MTERKPLKVISDIGPSGARSPIPARKPVVSKPSIDSGETIKVTVSKTPAAPVTPLKTDDVVKVQIGKSQYEQKASNEPPTTEIPEDIIPRAGELNFDDQKTVGNEQSLTEDVQEPVAEPLTDDMSLGSTDSSEEKTKSFDNLAKSASAEMEVEEKEDTRPLHGFIYSPPKQPQGDASGVQPESSAARAALQSPKIFDTTTLHPPISGQQQASGLVQASGHTPKNRHLKAVIITILVVALVAAGGFYVYSMGIL